MEFPVTCSVCGSQFEGPPSVQAHAEEGARVVLHMRACPENFCALVVADACTLVMEGGATVDAKIV